MQIPLLLSAEGTDSFPYWLRMIFIASVFVSFVAMVAIPAFLVVRNEVCMFMANRKASARKHEPTQASQASSVIPRGNTIGLFDLVSQIFASIAAVFVLTLVLSQFSVVLLRYLFSVGSIALQESVLYFHAMIFMFGASFGLACNTHVRLDVLYSKLKPRGQAIVDLIGNIGLLIPFAIVLLITGYPYVVRAWRTAESSIEVSGLQYVYLLKTVILIFALLLVMQAISRIIISATVVLRRKPERTHDDRS